MRFGLFGGAAVPRRGMAPIELCGPADGPGAGLVGLDLRATGNP
jgi:hypothetical protein